MQITKLDYEQVPQFSKRDKAYVEEIAALRPFFEHPVSIENFEKVIEAKKGFSNRKSLVNIIKKQYEHIKTNDKVTENIDALNSEKTFTVITGHQPHLFEEGCKSIRISYCYLQKTGSCWRSLSLSARIGKS